MMQQEAVRILSQPKPPQSDSDKQTIRQYAGWMRQESNRGTYDQYERALKFIASLRCSEYGDSELCKTNACIECFQERAEKALKGEN